MMRMPPDIEIRRLKGLRVFVVEDEALVAMNLEMMLEDLGCVVVGPALRFDTVVHMLKAGVEADVAILDVNLGGREVFPLAERLVAAGVPLIFATGYDQTGIPSAWHDHPILQKPYMIEDVAVALTRFVDKE